LQLLQNPL